MKWFPDPQHIHCIQSCEVGQQNLFWIVVRWINLGYLQDAGWVLPLNICLGRRKVGKGWSCVGKMGLMWLCGLILEFPPLPELICQSVLFSRLSASMLGFTHIVQGVILNQKKIPDLFGWTWLRSGLLDPKKSHIFCSWTAWLHFLFQWCSIRPIKSFLRWREMCNFQDRSDLLGLFCGQIVPSGLSSCVLDSGPQGPRWSQRQVELWLPLLTDVMMFPH